MIKTIILIKCCPCARYHSNYYAEQEKRYKVFIKGSQIFAAKGLISSWGIFYIFIFISDAHHCRSDPCEEKHTYKYRSDAEPAIGSIELYNFLTGRKSGTDNESDIRSGKFNNSACTHFLFHK